MSRSIDRLEPARQALFHRGEEARDGAVVVGEVREHLGGELAAHHLVDPALAQLLQHDGIVERIGDDDDLGVVLRRRAEHRWPADVDVLHRIVEGDARLGHRLLEGIEVDRDEVDRLDAVPRDGGAMLGEVAPREDAAVHRGVQRLHPAVEHLGEGGDLLDADDGNAGLPECRGRAAGGDDLPAELDQALGEGDGSALVADGNEGARHGPSGKRELGSMATGSPARAAASTTAGSSRCSCSSTRDASIWAVSPGRTGTRAWARIIPRSYSSSTRCTVQPLSAAPLCRTAS